MKKKTLVILTLVILTALSLSIVFLADSTADTTIPKLIEKETTPFKTKTCQIDLYPNEEITLNINETYTLDALGYQGSITEVAWESKDPSIASFNLFRGNQVKLIAYNPGRTEIIVRDQSLEDCTDYLFVRVRE